MRLLFPALGASPYHRFHGMLCGPAVAAQCISAFDGTIVFMPATYRPEDFAAAVREERTLMPYEVQALTLLKYYLLVLWSMTGLCSLLRQTQTVDASELVGGDGEKRAVAKPPEDHALSVHPFVVDALASRHGVAGVRDSVRLIRRFEFRFRLTGLWVAMHHYKGVDAHGVETLSLVEVYRGAPMVVCVVLAVMAAVAGCVWL